MDAGRDLLIEGVSSLKLAVDDNQINQLLAYLSLIKKWNKAYNLTAIVDGKDMITLHLLDSLTVAPYLCGNRVLDVGTGAGLPGIPLAICLPDVCFTLLDSNAKKTRFVQQTLFELKLTNVKVVHERVELFKPECCFTTIVTRAFSNLSAMLDKTRHVLTKDGKLIAMKGRCLTEEIALVDEPYQVVPVFIPGVEAERNLICISPIHSINGLSCG
jgi:16S rRNA (guanine527-N7)-methyltransferase